MQPLGQMIYVKKHYSIDKKIKLVGEPIKQKWNGFAQHVAATVSTNASVIILTLFSSLSNVSIYSVYHLVTNGISNVIMTAASGIESFLGNIIAQGDEKALKRSFDMIEWVVHFCVTILFTIAAIAITPFVTVYTDGISDTDYIQPLFGFLLVFAYMVQCLRIPYFRVIKASGHFKQTQNGSFIMAGINIVVSVGLVFWIGLVGVALGTLCAMLFHTVYFVLYLRKNILNRSIMYFLKHILTDAIVVCASFFVTSWLKLQQISIWGFLIYAIEVSMITLAVSVVINILSNYKLVKLCFAKAKGLVKKG